MATLKDWTFTKTAAPQKAQRGDFIQSLNHEKPSEGSILGTVTRVEVDDTDGVEYVYYKPLAEIRRDGSAELLHYKEMRVPQNGTPTSLGRVTKGIRILY